MSAQKMKTIAISLPPQMIEELDRVSERERRTRSEILRDALRRYITVAERGRMIPVEDALPEEIEAMRRADEEYVRGECSSLGHVLTPKAFRDIAQGCRVLAATLGNDRPSIGLPRRGCVDRHPSVSATLSG